MPPSPPMMAHLLSLGTQSKDAARALKTEWYVCGYVCLSPRVSACVCISESERQEDGDKEKEILSLTISAADPSICVCQCVFVRGTPAFVSAPPNACSSICLTRWRVLPVGPRLPRLPCSINKAPHAITLTLRHLSLPESNISGIWLHQGCHCAIVSQCDGWRLLQASQYPI